jgi:hypothetical protein
VDVLLVFSAAVRDILRRPARAVKAPGRPAPDRLLDAGCRWRVYWPERDRRAIARSVTTGAQTMIGEDLREHYKPVYIDICNRSTPLDGVNTAHYARRTPRSHWRLEAVTVGYDMSAETDINDNGTEYQCVVFRGSTWLPPVSAAVLPVPVAG